MSPATRRGALGRGLLFLGGLVGVGAETAAAAPDQGTLVLYARNLDDGVPGRRPGGLPQRGDRLTLRAELLDRPGGEPIGELHGAGFALHGPGAHVDGAERLELHTFKLRDGTIVGSGSGGTLTGEFAILGGTGRYAGVRGTYVARHERRERGGNGTAEFHLTFTT
jgi:hypothetical protein